MVKFNGTVATPTSWSTPVLWFQYRLARRRVWPIVAGGTTRQRSNFCCRWPGPASHAFRPHGAAGKRDHHQRPEFRREPGQQRCAFQRRGGSGHEFRNNTSVGVTVPNSATTGQVTVTVNGQASNGSAFTVITGGTLSGSVTSSSGGAAISGATVQALQSGVVKSSATTLANGSYSITNLTAGGYDVQVSASGFGTALKNSVNVSAGQTATANFSLSSPGSVTGETQPDGVTGIAGANVQVFVGSAAGSSATSDAGGNYSITGLNAGPYTLEQRSQLRHQQPERQREWRLSDYGQRDFAAARRQSHQVCL